MALSDGLVGYWSAWLGSSGYRLLDRSGRGNHGTLTSMDAGTDWVGSTIRGRSGYALDFDGANDHAATSEWRGMSGDYSASFWFRTSFATSGATCMLGSSYNGGGGVHILGVRGTDGALYGFAGSERWYGSGYNNNTWVLATIVRRFSDGQGTMFANGFSLGSQAGLGTLNPATGAGWRFGGTPFFGSQFPGQIAEVTFHGRMITLAEHVELLRLGPGWYRPYAKRPYGYAIAGFKAYWHRRQSQLIGGGVR